MVRPLYKTPFKLIACSRLWWLHGMVRSDFGCACNDCVRGNRPRGHDDFPSIPDPPAAPGAQGDLRRKFSIVDNLRL